MRFRKHGVQHRRWMKILLGWQIFSIPRKQSLWNGGIKEKKGLQGKNRNARLNNAFDCLENNTDGHFTFVLQLINKNLLMRKQDNY